eukprot:6161776-Prymnesium_polylepis.1
MATIAEDEEEREKPWHSLPKADGVAMQPGSDGVVLQRVVLREGSNKSSPKCGVLVPRTVVRAREMRVLADGTKRVRVDQGWLTYVKEDGTANL